MKTPSAGGDVVVRIEGSNADHEMGQDKKVDDEKVGQKKAKSASIAELYQFTSGADQLLLALAVVAATTSGTAIPMIL